MSERVHLLDAWRTFAILCMVIYHFAYDLGAFGLIGWSTVFSPPFLVFQRLAGYSFIIISGIAARLTRNNIRRGALVLACSALISAGAYLAGLPIWFGILHFLGCSMIIYGLTGRFFQGLPRPLGLMLYPALFIAAAVWTSNAGYVEARFLWPLGFAYQGFYSSDYYPLLPWFFLFLFGTSLGGLVRDHRKNRLLGVSVPGPLTWPGRHSLIIYLLHQPILYVLIWAGMKVFNV